MVRLTSLILAVLGLGWSLVACAQEEHAPFAAGTHYRVLEDPVAVPDGDKIEVREFFFYGCPHCFDAEPVVEDWLKDKPADVNFVRTPVLFLRNAEPLARAFYVAKSKDMLDEVHADLFAAIHKKREPLFTLPALARFFEERGMDRKTFNSLYSSFGVSTKIRQAEALTREFQIRGVPAWAVNGKYVIMNENLKSYQQAFDIIDYLVEKERKAMGGGK